MKMEFNEKALMATMNPRILLGCFLIIIAIAFLCARRYRNTNDFKKSSILYGGISIAVMIVFVLLEVPTIMTIGYIISGFVIMSLFSNHYFKQ